jgi:aminomuconate-semialdehyde/2-hydroxymuconate-6-semialdehyde dehydrogenase
MLKISNFIDNSFVPPQKCEYIESVNPANGVVEILIPNSTSEDVDAAVESAAKAFVSWSQTSVEYRSNILLKIADLISADLEEFAVAESKDNGKPLSLSRSVDIPRAIHNFRFFANAILNSKTFARDNGQFLNYTVKSPVGVAALISPWNLPLYLLTWKIAPAIAYGCTCVCKPSEFTSWTAYMLCKVIVEAGVPPGVVNMVFGNGSNAGSPLVSHHKVPLVSFTGGTATGQMIYKSCSSLNKKMSLELGNINC